MKTRKELEGKAALGGGPDDLISMTADLDIAREISRNLKIAVGIANGEHKPEDIIKMAEDEGIDISDADALKWLGS